MTADEYRAEAERLRETARRMVWALSEDREHLLDVAKSYEALAKITETLARQPIR